MHLIPRIIRRLDAIRQDPLPSICRITDPPRNRSKKHHERRLERIRQQQSQIESAVANAPRDVRPRLEARRFRLTPDLVDEWSRSEKARNPWTDEKRDLGLRE